MVREKTVMARLDGNKNANESGKEKRRKIECFLKFSHTYSITLTITFFISIIHLLF